MDPDMAASNVVEEYFPFDICDVDPDTDKTLNNIFTSHSGDRKGFVHVGPHKYQFPVEFRNEAHDLWNFTARSDDVWVACFPHSGADWMQEMIWLIANDMDFGASGNETPVKRFALFEPSTMIHEHIPNVEKNRNVIVANTDEPMPVFMRLSNQEERRYIRTHLPFSLMPPSVKSSGAKVIYLARNPKHAVVSHYLMNRLYRSPDFNGSFDDFWTIFEQDIGAWAPYWEHVREGWERRNDPNVMFLFYEEMKCDLSRVIMQVANFLGKTMYDPDVRHLHSHLSVNEKKFIPSADKANDDDSHVRVRKESVTWHNEYPRKIVDRVDLWIEANLSNTDMRFPNILFHDVRPIVRVNSHIDTRL